MTSRAGFPLSGPPLPWPCTRDRAAPGSRSMFAPSASRRCTKSLRERAAGAFVACCGSLARASRNAREPTHATGSLEGVPPAGCGGSCPCRKVRHKSRRAPSELCDQTDTSKTICSVWRCAWKAAYRACRNDEADFQAATLAPLAPRGATLPKPQSPTRNLSPPLRPRINSLASVSRRGPGTRAGNSGRDGCASDRCGGTQPSPKADAAGWPSRDALYRRRPTDQKRMRGGLRCQPSVKGDHPRYAWQGGFGRIQIQLQRVRSNRSAPRLMFTALLSGDRG